jgi:hypothetical protein
MSTATDPIADRRRMLRVLREEVLGPSVTGRVLPDGHALEFDNQEEFYGPHIQAGSRNEIAKGESPRRRFGAGILFPAGSQVKTIPVDPEQAGTAADEVTKAAAAELLSENARKKLEAAAERTRTGGTTEQEGDEMGITLANEFRPSSTGLSFLASLPPSAALRVRVKAGRYRSRPANLRKPDGKLIPANWWFRSLVVFDAMFSGDQLRESSGLLAPLAVKARNAQGLNLEIKILSRPLPGRAGAPKTSRLLTVSVVNRTALAGLVSGDEEHGTPLDEICAFQVEFSVTLLGGGKVLPYPERLDEQMDEEEESLALLYRGQQTFATGHGCAADWRTIKDNPELAWKLRGLPFPVVEVPSISPDLYRDKEMKDRILVAMQPLAGLVPGDDGLAAVREIVDRYGEWIRQKKKGLAGLGGHLETGERHLKDCGKCHDRMLEGLKLLTGDAKVREAFQLANHAIWLQQQRSFRSARAARFDPVEMRLAFEAAPPVPAGRGSWRPFQIAFLLMSLPSAVDGKAPDRDTVELIWFPTGGGKTEAYLGLTAFALFHRRLTDPLDDGTHVLMRYTLRLLTAQQFQRACGLICAMDHLRRSPTGVRLGLRPFGIGIWLGGDTTPNTRETALASFRDLDRGDPDADYNFIVLRCPWCGVQMGPIDGPARPAVRGRRGPAAPPEAPRLLGLQQREGTVVLHCPDPSCEYHHALPILVIDQDLYAAPPDLVIGTVDKFASLAWKREARSLFGIGPDGSRVKSPPGLIIQDELHLITGPLGSMAGLYEVLIEELCTDRSGGKEVRPKIISSTATTRRYQQQIQDLYNREDTCLFPPPGLEAGDSFFAAYAREPDGRLSRGRQYAGVSASSYPSGLTTNVRVLASLLQGARLLEDGEARDPWWTLLIFFNSLRELGNSLTLFQGDIPERIREISRRCLPDPKQPVDPKTGRPKPVVRYIDNPLELTGRILSSEVPKAIAQLEAVYKSDDKAVDVCLASNIIEVGVDIDRLSLMAVAGQPKTTAQYIQVTGRVGRRQDRPGLVAMIYSAAKPRDRSHYERFRSYHERLYAQVEPASVTPFTRPVLERALHAVMAGYVRQFGTEAYDDTPCPLPAAELERLKKLVLARVKVIDPGALETAREIFDQRVREWSTWNPPRWDPKSDLDNPSLLRYTSMYYPPTWEGMSWSTPTSMRSVDAMCQPEITLLYRKKAAPAADGAAPTPT